MAQPVPSKKAPQCLTISPQGEKLGEQGGAIAFAQAADDLGGMVTAFLVKQGDTIIDRAAFYVGGAVKQFCNPRLGNRTGAHRARFQRHIKAAAHKPFIAQFFACLANGKNFRMRSRVIKGAHLIARLRQNIAVLSDQHSPDRHFIGLRGDMRFIKCHLHKIITHQRDTSMAGAARATAVRNYGEEISI